MAGRNLFESYQRFGEAKLANGICVFISHNSKDKPMARAVASALLEMDIDIYFDEYDKMLQSAAMTVNDAAIVKCIEDGLNKSTHLLGLITKNTFESWWVPYEIGGASGRSRDCGHLVASNVSRLPSYIKVAPVLLDIDDLSKWLSKRITRTSEIIKKGMAYGTKSLLESYVPNIRYSSNITFY